VADTADHACGRIRIGDLCAEELRLTEIERRAPAASEKDHVVCREVQRLNRQRVGELPAEHDVGQHAVVARRPDRAPHRQRIDRNDAAFRTRDVHVHAGVQEHVVRHRQLRGKDAGGHPDVEHRVIRSDAQRASATHVERHGVGIDLTATPQPTDVSGIDSLPQGALDASIIPVTKRLFLDLLDPSYKVSDTQTIKNVIAEKIEGLAWGPDLKDGRHVLYVFSDNDLYPGCPRKSMRLPWTSRARVSR